MEFAQTLEDDRSRDGAMLDTEPWLRKAELLHHSLIRVENLVDRTVPNGVCFQLPARRSQNTLRFLHVFQLPDQQTEVSRLAFGRRVNRCSFGAGGTVGVHLGCAE